LHIRYGIETLGEKEGNVARKMRISSTELKQKRRRLSLVDLYLDWLGKTGQYHLVEGDEQAFTELEKYTKNIKDMEKEKTVRNEAFSLIKFPPEEGRLYDHLRRLFKHFDAVQKKFKNGSKPSSEEKSEPIGDDKNQKDDIAKDPLEAIAEINNGTEKDSRWTSSFDQVDKAKENIQKLIEAIQDAEAESRDKDDKNATFKTVKEVQRWIQGITIDSTTLQRDAIRMSLQEIIKISNELVQIIDKLRNPNA